MIHPILADICNEVSGLFQSHGLSNSEVKLILEEMLDKLLREAPTGSPKAPIGSGK